MSLYAPRMAASMMPRNRPITLSTTEAHSRRCRWITSQQLLTPVNSKYCEWYSVLEREESWWYNSELVRMSWTTSAFFTMFSFLPSVFHHVFWTVWRELPFWCGCRKLQNPCLKYGLQKAFLNAFKSWFVFFQVCSATFVSQLSNQGFCFHSSHCFLQYY